VDAQIKKGLTDICVLAVLVRGESYGWQIIKDLEPVIEISESTLYPVLKRLQQLGQVKMREVPYNGRLRRYFALEDLGRKRLTDFAVEQKELFRVYNFINEATVDEKADEKRRNEK
jgi:PadR family transcriptional regulator PadR